MSERMRIEVQNCTRQTFWYLEKYGGERPRLGTAATARSLAHADSTERFQEYRE